MAVVIKKLGASAVPTDVPSIEADVEIYARCEQASGPGQLAQREAIIREVYQREGIALRVTPYTVKAKSPAGELVDKTIESDHAIKRLGGLYKRLAAAWDREPAKMRVLYAKWGLELPEGV